MSLSPFGRQLRTWRKQRGLSQLELSHRAGTTPRYVSFIETGRARPGQDLVLRIAAALRLSLHDQNALLAAAGLKTAFPKSSLNDEQMAPLRAVIDEIIARHGDYPAWVMQGGMKVLRGNAAGERLMPGMADLTPTQMVESWFAPGPFRETVENWQEVVLASLAVLRKEVAQRPEPELEAALSLAERLASKTKLPMAPTSGLPVACPIFLIGGLRVPTIVAAVRFDHAVTVAAQDLRVELMFPTDEVGERFFRGLADAAKLENQPEIRSPSSGPSNR